MEKTSASRSGKSISTPIIRKLNARPMSNTVLPRRVGLFSQGGSVLDTKNHTSGEQLAFGVNAQADLTLLENHLTILGFQYVKDSIKRNERRNGSRATAIFRPPSFTYTVLPFPRPGIVNDNFDKQASLTTLSAFLQDEWDVTGDFSVTAGGALLPHQFGIVENQSARLCAVQFQRQCRHRFRWRQLHRY